MRLQSLIGQKIISTKEKLERYRQKIEELQGYNNKHWEIVKSSEVSAIRTATIKRAMDQNNRDIATAKKAIIRNEKELTLLMKSKKS